MTTTKHPTKTLAGGVRIPVLGLGVWQTPSGEVTRRAVRHALDVGYRHIDTARIYENEEDVGRAIRESGVPREEIFVTTKLWNTDHGYDKAQKACDASLRRLGLDYVDLYLVHWPVAKLRKDTWRAMVKLREDGKCRAIGVSNYTARHLEELMAESDVLPAVNQIEIHPFLFPRDIVALCDDRGIAIEAYSPLTHGRRLRDRRIVELAERLGKTPAQILIRWGLDHGFVSLPKSEKPHRIEENAAVFDFTLPKDARQALDAMNEDLHTCWDPTDAP
jgi:diketogulonate reductase-like aldo/keto reductase